MSEQSDQTSIPGAIRVRSNVSLTADYGLVPGDAIRSYDLDIDELTAEQQEEKMRYEPCSLCHRMIYEIFEFGCDNYTCQQQRGRQRIVSREQAAKRRAEQQRLDDRGGFGTL